MLAADLDSQGASTQEPPLPNQCPLGRELILTDCRTPETALSLDVAASHLTLKLHARQQSPDETKVGLRPATQAGVTQ